MCDRNVADAGKYNIPCHLADGQSHILSYVFHVEHPSVCPGVRLGGLDSQIGPQA